MRKKLSLLDEVISKETFKRLISLTYLKSVLRLRRAFHLSYRDDTRKDWSI